MLSENVTAKLYKSNKSGDLQELTRSIVYTVHVVEHADIPAEITPTPEHDVAVIFPDLSPASIAIADAKKIYAAMDTAPWKPLLSKVEKFNTLVNGVSEVSFII